MISKQIEMGKTNLQLELDQFALYLLSVQPQNGCSHVFALLL